MWRSLSGSESCGRERVNWSPEDGEEPPGIHSTGGPCWGLVFTKCDHRAGQRKFSRNARSSVFGFHPGLPFTIGVTQSVAGKIFPEEKGPSLTMGPFFSHAEHWYWRGPTLSLGGKQLGMQVSWRERQGLWPASWWGGAALHCCLFPLPVPPI